AEMTPAVTRATCILTSAAETTLATIVERHDGLSARAIDRIIKVARTAIDLAGRDLIDTDDITLAASYRVLDYDPSVDPRKFTAVPPLSRIPPITLPSPRD
ncbi:MAG TPA: hypothetical protein VM261_00910, partial [Kofleriaceae bacterium]|nr:hypothetical protein [Kofleriaceae bacterium]